MGKISMKRERIGSLKESKTFQKGGQECLKK